MCGAPSAKVYPGQVPVIFSIAPRAVSMPALQASSGVSPRGWSCKSSSARIPLAAGNARSDRTAETFSQFTAIWSGVSPNSFVAFTEVGSLVYASRIARSPFDDLVQRHAQDNRAATVLLHGDVIDD